MQIELRDLIGKILGNIVVHGENYRDKEVLKNIDYYKEALDEILDSLGACSLYSDDSRKSCSECGKKAKEILEGVYERIGYFIQKDEVEE